MDSSLGTPHPWLLDNCEPAGIGLLHHSALNPLERARCKSMQELL